MFGFSKSSPVAEHEAEGEIDRVYHQVRQSLRVTGVNLIFRKWASQKGLLPVVWDAVRANVETRALENAADQVRAEAAGSVATLGHLNASAEIALGESQAYQVRSALELYHYINPKLLLIAAMVRRSLQGESSSPAIQPEATVEFVERGIPPRMHAMEMEDSEPDDQRLREIFSDIQQTLGLESINSDYRTLALWPDYLAIGWTKLKPVVQRPEYEQAASSLRERARTLAAAMPFPVALGRDKIEDAGADFDKAVESTTAFQGLLPGLILNVAFFLQDWRSGEELTRSPFPAETRTVRPVRNF